MPRRNHKNRSTKARVSNVRVVDEYAGTDGVKLDRILQAMQNSHSQTRIICGDYYGLTSSTSANTARNISYQDIVGTDDFQSLAAQFETFRVKAIRFDVYNLNLGSSGFTAFSTYHASTVGRAGVFTIDQIIDGPDSQVISAGQGKISFTWFAKGTLENEFQQIISTPASTTDFGGLRGIVGTGTVAGTAYQVVMKAVVDFRGRL